MQALAISRNPPSDLHTEVSECQPSQDVAGATFGLGSPPQGRLTRPFNTVVACVESAGRMASISSIARPSPTAEKRDVDCT